MGVLAQAFRAGKAKRQREGSGGQLETTEWPRVASWAGLQAALLGCFAGTEAPGLGWGLSGVRQSTAAWRNGLGRESQLLCTDQDP